jgi:hypothetical protein
MSRNSYDITQSPAYRRAAEQRRRDSEELEAQQAREVEERREANEEARNRYLAKLAAEKEERRKVAEAKLEEQLAPDKARTQREWLANHPGKTVAEFERYAWQHLRLNIIADKERELAEQHMAALRATGKYSL